MIHVLKMEAGTSFTSELPLVWVDLDLASFKILPQNPRVHHETSYFCVSSFRLYNLMSMTASFGCHWHLHSIVTALIASFELLLAWAECRCRKLNIANDTPSAMRKRLHMRILRRTLLICMSRILNLLAACCIQLHFQFWHTLLRLSSKYLVSNNEKMRPCITQTKLS